VLWQPWVTSCDIFSKTNRSMTIRSYSTAFNASAGTAIAIVGQFVGFLGMIYAAKVFGATTSTDVIYFSMALAAGAVAILNGFNGNILLPQFIVGRQNGTEEDVWQMIRTTFTFGSSIAVCFIAIGHIYFVDIIIAASHFDERVVREARDISPVIVLGLYFTYVVSLLTVIFQGLRNFLIPSLASAIGAMIGLGILLISAEEFGASAIALGYLANMIAVATIMWVILARHGRVLFFGLSRFASMSKVLKLVPPVILNQLAAVIVILYPNYAASALDGGDLTAIMYARRIFEILPALIIIPIVTALAPMLSELLTNSRESIVEDRLQKISALLYSGLVPITAFVWLCADELMTIIYGRGAYNLERVAFTADNLRVYMLGLVALGSNAVITRALVASQNIKAAYISLLLAVAPALCVPLFTEMGVNYIGRLGVASGYLAYLLIVHQPLGYWIWKKNLGEFSMRRQLLSIGRPCIISFGAAAVAQFATRLINLSALEHVFFVSILFFGFYAVIHYLLATEEYALARSTLRRIFFND
jgi:putative peptidoglycan lipid II flippase